MQRSREIERLRLRLLRHGSPRLRMLLMVMLTGATGFLASYVMLRQGIDSIALRYPLALAIAYGVFLLLLWLWLRLRPDDRTLDVPDLPGAMHDRDASHGDADTNDSSSVSGDWLDGAVADEAALPLLVLAFVVALALASLWVVYAAPALFGELLFDAALAAGFYRRLRRGDARHWLDTALRHTCLPFLATLLLLVAFGFAVQHLRPDANSIGDLLQPATCTDCR
jgi:H+/Cl- antiporter ClcA